jgi:ATP-dependent Lon protease
MRAVLRQAATRELRRLQRSSDQAPGHAMSRAYLETLADLPWNRFACSPPGAQAGRRLSA